jgi:hypothetical protein
VLDVDVDEVAVGGDPVDGPPVDLAPRGVVPRRPVSTVVMTGLAGQDTRADPVPAVAAPATPEPPRVTPARRALDTITRRRRRRLTVR